MVPGGEGFAPHLRRKAGALDVFDFEPKFHRTQWADFKISKPADIHLYRSFDFYSQFSGPPGMLAPGQIWEYFGSKMMIFLKFQD